MDGQASIPATIDLATIKRRQQAAWRAGDYAVIGTTLQIVGELLSEAVDLPATSECSMSPQAVCKEDVEYAKPHPDLFLACRERLDIPAQDCFVVGDAVWDMLAVKRSNMLGIGLLTGGIGRNELTDAGAYRVYNDPAELDARRYELGLASD